MLYVGEGSEREQWHLLCSLPDFSHLPHFPQSNWALLVLIFPDGWVCIRSRPLWVSPTNSPVRLGVSPAAALIPTGVFNQRFVFISPQWSQGLHGLLRSSAIPPSLYMRECGATGSASHHFVGSASCSLTYPIPQSAISQGPPAPALL